MNQFRFLSGEMQFRGFYIIKEKNVRIMGIATGYFRMLRVQDWIFGYFFIPIIGGIAAAGVTPMLVPVAVISFCTLAFGFVINNVADVEIDRVHTIKCKMQKNPLVSQTVTLRGTWILLILLALVSLCLSLVWSVPAFFSIAATLTLFTVYSIRPFRFKERYILDLVIHGLMTGAMLFLVGYLLPSTAIPPLSAKIVSLCVLFTCIGGMALLVHQIGDYREDCGHSTTTVVQLGKRKSWCLLAVLTALSLIALAAVNFVVTLELWVLWGSVVLFAIPVFLLHNDIREDFMMKPVPDPDGE
jgi:4-hydroxybenzoate polyprenyltransferase